MNHAVAVRVSEGFGDLLSDLADAIKRRPLALLHGVGQGLAIDEFHHQKRHAFILADVKDGHNSGMRQGACGASLAVEALAELSALVASQVRRKDGLEGDDAIHCGIFGAEDAAHGAVAKFIDDFVPPDILRNRHSLIRSLYHTDGQPRNNFDAT